MYEHTCVAALDHGKMMPWWKVDLGLVVDILDVFYYGRHIDGLGMLFTMNALC